MPVTVLVCGSRHWPHAHIVRLFLAQLEYELGDQLVVIHGDCPRGADRMARDACIALGIEQRRWPAQWDRGPRAGLDRNRAMVAALDPERDRVLAFRATGPSPGTDHTLGLALRRGIRSTVIHLADVEAALEAGAEAS